MIKAIDKLSYIVLLVAVIILPWWVDRGLSNAVISGKQYLLFWLMGGILIAQGLKIMISKKIRYRMSIIDIPGALLVVGVFLSALLSVRKETGFIGSGDFFVFSCLFMGLLAAWYGLSTNLVTTLKRWQGLYDALIGSGIVTLVLFIARALFKIDLVASLWGRSVLNVVDDSNGAFGLWVVVLVVLSLGQLLHKTVPSHKKIFYFAAVALSVVAMVLLSFPVVWIMLAGALGALLLLGGGFIQEVDLIWLSAVFALFILTAIFIVFDTPHALQSVLPVEATLNHAESWSITWKTWSDSVKNLLLGTGPGTFGIDFSQFRSTVVNSDPVAATLRFNRPFNTVFALMSENGLLVVMAGLLLVCVSGGYLVATTLKLRAKFRWASGIEVFESENKRLQWYLLLVGIAWGILTLGMGWFSFGPVLWWLWAMLLGLLMTGLSFENHRLVQEREWAVDTVAEQQVLFSFVIVSFLSVITFGEIWSWRYYTADTVYAAALKATDFQQAENKLTQAINLHESVERYHITLAQAYLLQAVTESRQKEVVPQRVGNLVGLAVNQARRATELSPLSVEGWENLATMYENAAPLIPAARQWGIAALNEGKKLEPSNPFLAWRLGNNYTLAAQWDEAVASYQAALNLKPDYAAAYISLATAYEQQNRLDKAVEVYQGIANQITGNPELLFQYGRVLYNRNQGTDRKMAVSLWEAALTLDPRHSNSLYSLGFWYESIGKKSAARSYYQKTAELNPDNQDLVAKLKALGQ